MEFLSPDMSDYPETGWDALSQHGDAELLKLFPLDIQDGHNHDHLETFK